MFALAFAGALYVLCLNSNSDRRGTKRAGEMLDFTNAAVLFNGIDCSSPAGCSAVQDRLERAVWRHVPILPSVAVTDDRPTITFELVAADDDDDDADAANEFYSIYTSSLPDSDSTNKVVVKASTYTSMVTAAGRLVGSPVFQNSPMLLRLSATNHAGAPFLC